MLKNYLKIAWRNLHNNPIYSLINIGGLTISMACCLLIFQYVAFEFSFDTFNKNASVLYRVDEAENSNISSTMGYAMGPAVAQEVPEVIHFARLHPEYNNAVVSNPRQPEKVFEEEKVFYADSTFFQMFSYPLRSGNINHVLEPGTVLLSQSAARKYFGDKNPMGQVLKVAGWIKGSYRVTGVFKDVPANSHLQFDILLPMADLLQKSYNSPLDAWNWENFITYMQLRKDANLYEVEHKFTGVLKRHLKKTFGRVNDDEHIILQPLRDIHLNDSITAPNTAMSSYQTVYFFILIGLLILVIALVNYINLTTARAINRAREVGVLKAIGAQKKQLRLQFLCESTLTILLATILVFILVHPLTPAVNSLAGTNLTDIIWSRSDFWIIFTSVFLISILLAGWYPAFILSSFKPVRVLKGNSEKFSGTGIWLRRGLVAFQFATAMVLIAGATTIYTQLNYMRNMNLGINLKQILTIPGPRVLPEGTDRQIAVETFTQELRKLPPVRQVATSASVPGQGFEFTTVIHNPANPSKEIVAAGTHIDTSFAKLYGIQLLAGKGFSHNSSQRLKSRSRPVIITETAAHAAGFNKASNVLGRKLFTGRVVGIFKDFKWSSAHQKRKNAFFVLGRDNRIISVKIDEDNMSKAIVDIKNTYKQLFPGSPFRYAFVEKQFNQHYQGDRRFARLFTFFAGLAIVIACLGLFGLATYAAEQRTKEIGIRKVLGASELSIVGLLTKDFLKLVVIGFIIAVPVGWYAMHRWLQNFAYKIDISPWIFLLAGGLTLVIALAAVSWQSIRAALANPVDSLRSE